MNNIIEILQQLQELQRQCLIAEIDQFGLSIVKKYASEDVVIYYSYSLNLKDKRVSKTISSDLRSQDLDELNDSIIEIKKFLESK